MIGETLGILAASLIGSAHCAAMCGAFVCVYSGPGSPRDAAMLRAHALYNGGRLVSYLALGALAGALGSGVAQLGVLVGVGRMAALVAGVMMVGWAVVTIAAQRGVAVRAPKLPDVWQRLLSRVMQSLRNQPVGARAAILGLSTTLIPCGWLYVFVAAAGGTASVTNAMLVMAVFWLGTLPALAAVGLGAQRFLAPLRVRLPMLGAVTVLLIGVLAIAGRLAMIGVSHGH